LPIGSWLTDESIKIFASIFPNLQLCWIWAIAITYLNNFL
jgi:hypothetical protein